MKLEYIGYGLSRVVVCIIFGIILGSFLRLLNVNNDIATIVAIVFVNILLIYSGYSFAKYPTHKKYVKSLLLSFIISFLFSIIFYFLKSFNITLTLESFLNLFICMSLGVFLHFLRFNIKNKS